MPNKKISYIKCIEYLLNNDFVLSYKDDIYLSYEDQLYCFDKFDEDENGEGEFFFSIEDLFEKLKISINDFEKSDFEKNENLNYSSDLTKKYLASLLKIGFKIESKIMASIKSHENKYVVEYLGYDFLPNENKGMTTKNYEVLNIACDKFEKIHNSFLESIKVG